MRLRENERRELSSDLGIYPKSFAVKPWRDAGYQGMDHLGAEASLFEARKFVGYFVLPEGEHGWHRLEASRYRDGLVTKDFRANGARLMQSDTGKRWLRLARAASERLTGIHRSQRAQLIDDIAMEYVVSANTVRRALAAFRFVRTEAPRYGVSLDAVQAPISTIETLTRIAKIAPDDAGVFTRSALLGTMTYTSLYAHYAMLEEAAREEAREASPTHLNIDSVIAKIKRDLGAVGDYQIKLEPSRFGRAMKANLEFSRHGSSSVCENAVAFFASDIASAAERLSAEELLVSMTAASVAFLRVYFVFCKEAQWSEVEMSLRDTRVDFGRVKKLRICKT